MLGPSMDAEAEAPVPYNEIEAVATASDSNGELIAAVAEAPVGLTLACSVAIG